MNIISKIPSMYITLMSVIMAGVMNMVFTKTDYFQRSHPPIDHGLVLRDGKRLFGDNKTWKGFFGMVVCGGLSQVLWGAVCKSSVTLTDGNALYDVLPNTVFVNLFVGLLFGLAYALFELPNSFLKRRLDITPGKTISGFWKFFFVFLDQADSVFGCALVVWLFYDLGIVLYLAYVLVGALTHIILNVLLYLAKLRKNPF